MSFIRRWLAAVWAHDDGVLYVIVLPASMLINLVIWLFLVDHPKVLHYGLFVPLGVAVVAMILGQFGGNIAYRICQAMPRGVERERTERRAAWFLWLGVPVMLAVAFACGSLTETYLSDRYGPALTKDFKSALRTARDHRRRLTKLNRRVGKLAKDFEDQGLDATAGVLRELDQSTNVDQEYARMFVQVEARLQDVNRFLESEIARRDAGLAAALNGNRRSPGSE